MLNVTGFRGLTFNLKKTGSLNLVVTPPYDVISDTERAQLAAASPYNTVHLILPEDQAGKNRYEMAAETLQNFLAEGVLEQDDTPKFYLLRQTFTGLDGNTYVRKGFFGVTRLPEPEEQIILGHERTFQGPVDDRIRLTEATRANLGAVFSLYSDPNQELADFLGQMDQKPTDAVAETIDGVRQEFWRVAYDEAVTKFFEDKMLYIADGHHRFQTAMTYRDTMREAGGGPDDAFNYVLMGFVSLDDPGLIVNAAHRLLDAPEGFEAEAFLAQLDAWFEIEPVAGDLMQALEEKPVPLGGCIIGLALHGKGDFLLNLRDIERKDFLGDDHGPAWRDLDVAILHRGIIESLLKVPEGTQFVYEKNAANGVKSVHEGEKALGFFLHPVREDQIRACARAGERMPQKSTYFFPKLPTGGVFHRLV